MADQGGAIEPSEFDMVVLGTGLVESMVAAAAARAGKSVLQLDAGSFYGGPWSSLSLEEFLQALNEAPSASDGALNTGSSCSGDGAAAQQDASFGLGISGAAVLRQQGGADLGPSGKYNLDLAPKVLYGAGPLIEVLLGSGAHNYTEFKLVQGSYMVGPDGALQSVPASRSEVFKDRSLGLAQKRALMKFLKGCSEALEGAGPLQGSFDDRPFAELMRQQGLEPQLQALLLHAVLMADHVQQAQPAQQQQQQPGPAGSAAAAGQLRDSSRQLGGDETAAAAAAAASAEGEESGSKPPAAAAAEHAMTGTAALRMLGVYMRSVGRYGQDAGPFLTPMYGCGELPQALCRVSAVAGALQVLRCQVEGPIFDEHTFSCIGVELGTGQVIRCQQLAAGQAYLQEWLSTFHPELQQAPVHRCTTILDGPVVPGEQQTLLVFPPGQLPGSEAHAVRGLALCSSTKACPEGRYVLHLWASAAPPAGSPSQLSAAQALRCALDALADTSGLAEPQQQQQQQQQEVEASPLESSAASAGIAASAAIAGTAEAPAIMAPEVPGKSRALLAAFFTRDRTVISRYTQAWPNNTVLCPSPDHTATFLSAVEEAKGCFARLYPQLQPFPLDPRQPDADPGSDDDEALEALQAALGVLPGAATSSGGREAAVGGSGEVLEPGSGEGGSGSGGREVVGRGAAGEGTTQLAEQDRGAA